MQAGVTTLNIQGPAGETEKPAEAATTKFTNHRQVHNHDARFGRYSKSCLACQAKYPAGPPKRIPKPTPPVVPSLTREDVMELLREHAPKAVEAAEAAPTATPSAETTTLERLVQLMLNRESRTLQKEDADEKRKQQSRQDMVKMAKEQEALTSNIQANCGWEYGRVGSHTKENGRSAINGQVHNDGLYHPICFRCFKAFPPVKPSAEQLRSGVSN